ncbi:MAG: hypothetical protein QME63_04580 [Actinomycetota bacterium]|nr:hypothetical protein [Actinomycetota bacterium]
MDLNRLGLALISYLTGALVVFAYTNRNRYVDLALASIAIFTFGTSMLLNAFGILADLARILLNLSTFFMAFAVLFLLVRLGQGFYYYMKKYMGRK